jgi:DNA polymerase-3 subunit gamma/tau
MLGLADRGRIRRLLELVLAGDAATALSELDEAHGLGIDPSGLLRGMMEVLHSVTRTKAGAQPDALSSVEQRQTAEEVAQRLSWSQIHRLWQMLLKGLQDVQIAPDPQEAATMALLRLIHSAELPDPSALLRKLSAEGASAGAAAPRAQPSPRAPSALLPADFRSLVAGVERSGKHLLAQQLHDHVGLVRFAPPELALKPMRPLGPDFARDLAAALKAMTGTSWQVSLSDSPSEPSLLDQEKIAEETARDAVLADANVKAVLDAFPDAILESYATTGGA